MDKEFWRLADRLVSESQIRIDRPKNSAHPRYPDCIYPVDYGFLADTGSMDGDGIDVWVGTSGIRTVTGALCTLDLVKRDSEVKLLIGCSEEETRMICAFHNDSDNMKAMLIERKE